MRIVFYSHGSGVCDGGTLSLITLVCGLSAKCKSLVIFPQNGPAVTELQSKGIECRVIHHEWWAGKKTTPKIKSYKEKIRNAKQIWRKRFSRLKNNYLNFEKHLIEIMAFKPDVIYTNTAVIPMGIAVAKKLNIPHIWHIREFMQLDYGFYPDWGWACYTKCLRMSDAVIVNSNALKQFLMTLSPHSNYIVVYNGIVDKNVPIKNLSTKNDPFIFLMVGIIQEQKGQHIALKAAAEIKKIRQDFKIIFVGGGDIETLQHTAQSLGVTSFVEFRGQQNNVDYFYKTCHCLLMCSKHEAFGRVTVEAMQYGLPVIGYQGPLCGTAEIIEDGKTGLLYSGGHVELALKMLELMSHPEMIKRMGRNAQNIVKKNFSVDRYCNEIEKIIFNILTKQQRSIGNENG